MTQEQVTASAAATETTNSIQKGKLKSFFIGAAVGVGGYIATGAVLGIGAVATFLLGTAGAAGVAAAGGGGAAALAAGLTIGAAGAIGTAIATYKTGKAIYKAVDKNATSLTSHWKLGALTGFVAPFVLSSALSVGSAVRMPAQNVADTGAGGKITYTAPTPSTPKIWSPKQIGPAFDAAQANKAHSPQVASVPALPAPKPF